MKLVVAGSRSIENRFAVSRAIFRFVHAYHVQFDTLEIVHGGADGVDTLAGDFARTHGLEETVFEPDYDSEWKKAAPLKRNAEMAEYGDALVAVWDGVSSGTQHMVRCAMDEGIPVMVFPQP